jgi:basic membrane lipoprotein Med (substrate-binding protein (PBP1-ABC) superfamily)
MAQNDRIGYIASYPIFGVPASINAFALGAQMTNPRAQIELRWSCVEGTPQTDLYEDGIRVISNREAPSGNQMLLDFCNYGTYQLGDRGDLVPFGTPLWVWGRFYEFAVRSILSGGWKQEKGEAEALNYWLGMDSGVIDVNLSDKLPAGVRCLAELLQKSMKDGTLDPFARRIVSQDGQLRNDGSRSLTPEELLHMDWLCNNVNGSIPSFDQILPYSQAMVRELGIYRDEIPMEKEGAL